MVILPGIRAYAECPVAPGLIIRPEITLNLGYASPTIGRNVNGFGLSLEGTLDSRWYYNYNRRLGLKKSVYRNSANFISLRTTFLPGVVVAKSSNAIVGTSGFTIIPVWGLRRPVGKFVFEAFAGIGYRRTGQEGRRKTSGGALDLSVGIGF